MCVCDTSLPLSHFLSILFHFNKLMEQAPKGKWTNVLWGNTEEVYIMQTVCSRTTLDGFIWDIFYCCYLSLIFPFSPSSRQSFRLLLKSPAAAAAAAAVVDGAYTNKLLLPLSPTPPPAVQPGHCMFHLLLLWRPSPWNKIPPIRPPPSAGQPLKKFLFPIGVCLACVFLSLSRFF